MALPPYIFVHLLETDTGVRNFFDNELPGVVPWLASFIGELSSPYTALPDRGQGLSLEPRVATIIASNGVTYKVESEGTDKLADLKRKLVEKDSALESVEVIDVLFDHTKE